MRDSVMEISVDVPVPVKELSVSFGYYCDTNSSSSSLPISEEFDMSDSLTIWNSSMRLRNGSFSCLSGAALSANATLANTSICNGIIGEEILPSIDSPKSFRRMASSPSLTRLDLVSSSIHNGTIPIAGACLENTLIENEGNFQKPNSAPSRTESSSFLNAMDVQTAGGAAGEDRVQAVCSKENGWLFCGIYDGFNGRDAADFLACTLYDKTACALHNLEWRTKMLSSLPESTPLDDQTFKGNISLASDASYSSDELFGTDTFRSGVIDCLEFSLAQAEVDFLHMVEQEMEDRPDLVSIGSCVLVALIHLSDIYILNLGDSRAILATNDIERNDVVKAIQLTETHSVDNELECQKILVDHPDDPCPIYNGRVKGKLKITRAFGVGYLKESKMNDMLMGILRIRDLCSPPYIYSTPFTTSHRVTENDCFAILGSDGLFDFFTNDEIVQLVDLFVKYNPFGDPAKHLIELLVQRAADVAGISTEELLSIPAGRRRKYHDDVTVMVIMLGNRQRTTTASTSL